MGGTMLLAVIMALVSPLQEAAPEGASQPVRAPRGDGLGETLLDDPAIGLELTQLGRRRSPKGTKKQSFNASALARPAVCSRGEVTIRRQAAACSKYAVCRRFD